jgi:hypothetical protein
MQTFKELYEFLRGHNEDSIIGWLKDSWDGKDKQESLLRLFAGLGLITKLQEWDICNGNYNTLTIAKRERLRELFCDDNKTIKLNDKGDSSDLTGISKSNDKKLLVTTSKNLGKDKMQVGDLQIEKITQFFEQYQQLGYSMTLAVCIRNNVKFKQMLKGMERTSGVLRTLCYRPDTIVIDWKDLDEAFQQFKRTFKTRTIESICDSDKYVLCLKMHQRLGVMKTLSMKNVDNKRNILWGHIQRSGKSYIIAGCIIEDSVNKDKCNYFVITTAPNETTNQQRNVFQCLQLQGFNVIVADGSNKNPTLRDRNIIICSKQFLQNKVGKAKNINWLRELEFEMRFLDESHNGGTTELAKQTLGFYGNNAFTVQITATYAKPATDYSIPKDSWVLWDLEDVQLCKTIDREGSVDRLVDKHGETIKSIIATYTTENIIEEYSKYPDLWLLTDRLDAETVSEIIHTTQHNEYGWSTEGCFTLKQAANGTDILLGDGFQNETETLKMWYRIFGKRGNFDATDDEYPDETVFLKRIEKICKNTHINSRWMGEGAFVREPMIIMAFLPQHNIDIISQATDKLLRQHKVVEDYEIAIINSKTGNDPKQTIENARIKARNKKLKGVLVLSGKQCSLGVSIENCDIVLLLNNNTGVDMINQMMFRCMTEGDNKKCAFVVDLNIHRVINTVVDNYATLTKPDVHPKDAIKYVLQAKLLNLNGDHWMPTFNNDVAKITSFSENIYEVYSSNTKNALQHLLDRLQFKKVLLTVEEQIFFNVMFNAATPTSCQLERLARITTDTEDAKIKKGIEKTKLSNSNDETIDTIDDTRVDFMDILKHIIPLICLLTIHDTDTSFVEMFNYIQTKQYVLDILTDQLKSWWGKDIDTTVFKKFVEIYTKYMKDDKETIQIIRVVKELFLKNVNNSNELSKLVDKYLVPQELEKKKNAEISTPYALRQEMLDKIPCVFWESKQHKVFEPCAGKGGFVVDIIGRFMIGLEKAIPDDKTRYKTIVEDCLYFSDINPTNIFICKLLVDPYNEYILNWNEGNTLELDIKEKWNIDVFDAVIGNPPYNEDPDNSKDPHMKPVYQDWVYKFNELSRMLLFITPSKWFSSFDKLLVKLREYMKLCNIEFIKHYPDDDVFKNVKIKGGVSYYLINKQFEGKTLFNNSLIDLTKYDILVEPKYYDLLTKIHKYNNNKNLSELYCSQGTFLNSKTEKELLSTGDISCYVSKNKGFKKYISKEKIKKEFDYWKVITPAAAYKGTSGFGDIYLLNDNEIHSRSYISFKVKSKQEAESLFSYLKCKLVQILLSLRKQTHNVCNSKNFIWIPLVPLNQEWNDDKLYEYFELDECDITMIKDLKLVGSYTK